MDFNGVKEIIEEVNASNISYFEYKTNDGHIKMDKSLTRSIGSVNTADEVSKVVSTEIAEPTIATSSSIKSEVVQSVLAETLNNEVEGQVIKAPMVGTFYKAASQDSNPYVVEGQKVKKGDILCIIEAMKLMNEIESDFAGTIAKILVKDGDMVEYGQPLFVIKED